jgi:hypothetical protein
MAMRWLKAVLMAFVVFAAAGCGRQAVESLRVNVRYTPKSQAKAEALTWVRPEVGVALAPVVDERADKTRIGENVEGTPAISVYEHPPGSSASTIQSAMQQELSKLGVRLVAAPAEAQRVLQIALVHFWVSEDNTYNAECRLRVRVVDATGKELSTILVTGDSKRFGRSLSEENYLEALSGAFVEAFENLIHNAQFQQAMTQDGAPGVEVPGVEVPLPAAELEAGPPEPAPAE